jgi:hypothetical protein
MSKLPPVHGTQLADLGLRSNRCYDIGTGTYEIASYCQLVATSPKKKLAAVGFVRTIIILLLIIIFFFREIREALEE